MGATSVGRPPCVSYPSPVSHILAEEFVGFSHYTVCVYDMETFNRISFANIRKTLKFQKWFNPKYSIFCFADSCLQRTSVNLNFFRDFFLLFVQSLCRIMPIQYRYT